MYKPKLNLRKHFVAFAIALAFAPFAHAQQWVLQVRPQWQERSGWALFFEMKYTGGKPVRIFASDLPWGIRERTKLFAFSLEESGRTLMPALYIDDPKFDPLVVQPNQILSGTIELQTRFPQIRKHNLMADAVVCYVYEMQNLVSDSNAQPFKDCVFLKQATKMQSQN